MGHLPRPPGKISPPAAGDSSWPWGRAAA